jgi:outer membrane receptor protein involved in Fe transport
MKVSFFLILIFIINSIIGAKSFSGYSLSGVVVDSANNSALPGVTVIVNSSNGKTIGGASTDLNGKFNINIKSEDKVVIRLSMIGYETKFIDVQLTDNSGDLGTLKIKATSIHLSDVVIKSTRPMVEYFVDKQVINIEKVPGSNGSVADALRNSGIVDVDQSTNKVSIRGNSEVKILIDGKPMQMAENILGQLPAASVDKVEVITSASAKDDPEGDAGILNIITKTGGLGNYNGAVSLTASNVNMNFGNVMLNYRTGKFNFFSNIMGGLGKMRFDNNIDRTNYNSESFYLQKSRSISDMRGYLTNLKAGFDFDYDTANTFTLSGNFYRLKYNQDIHTDNNIFSKDNSYLYYYLLKNTGNLDNLNYTISGFYKRKFDSNGQELTVDAFYSNLVNDFDTDLETEYTLNPDFPALQNTLNKIKNNTVIIKSDYVNPGTIGKFETGYHFTLRDRSNDYIISNYNYINNNWFDNLSGSNIFTYKENIHALYLMYTNSISKFEFKAGLRAEQTFTSGNQATSGEIFSKSYSSFFPSVMLAYKMSQQMQINLNYSRRINRPRMEYINPFTVFNGPNNFSKGNPNLEPTYVNLYEFKLAQFLNLYYSNSKGNPQPVETSVSDSITMNTRINMSSVKTYGLELTIPYINTPQFPFKLPDFVTFIYLRYNLNKSIQSGNYLTENLSYSRVFWTLSANAGFRIWYDLDIMFSCRYVPVIKDERNYSYPNTYLVFVLSRDFFDKKLKVSLVFNDILNSNRRRYETFGSNFYSYSENINVNNKGIFLSFNYSFNDFKSRRERNIDDGRDKTEDGFKISN